MRVEPFAQRGPDEAHGLVPGSVGVSQALFSVRRAVEGPALGVGSAGVDLPAEARSLLWPAPAGVRRWPGLSELLSFSTRGWIDSPRLARS